MFDLDRLTTLVQENHLAAVIVIDTNIFIKNPDYETWKTSVKDPVFLVSDVILDEILRVEHKQRPPSSQDAQKAHKALDRLLEAGELHQGVYVDKVGWFLAVYCPSKERLQPGLEQLGALVETHGRNDAIFLLLTKQCSEDLPDRTVVFVTGDQGLYTYVKFRQVPVHSCRELPDDGFDSWLKTRISKPLKMDWDKVLDTVERRVEATSLEVSLTLTSKRFWRNWPFEVDDPDDDSTDDSTIEPTDVIVAEGHGSIMMPRGPLAFLWRVPFKPWISADMAEDALRGQPNPIDWSRCYEDGMPVMAYLMEESDLDFLGRESEVSDPMRKGLYQKLALCGTAYSMSVAGLPSLQSPVALTEHFNKMNDVLKSIAATAPNYVALRRALSTWLSTHNQAEAGLFIDDVTSSWNIGHTVRTRVPC